MVFDWVDGSGIFWDHKLEDGARALQYENWDHPNFGADEPDNFADERCVRMGETRCAVDDSFVDCPMWENVDCDDMLTFVCEFRMFLFCS